jgi:hypothetical protein
LDNIEDFVTQTVLLRKNDIARIVIVTVGDAVFIEFSLIVQFYKPNQKSIAFLLLNRVTFLKRFIFLVFIDDFF